MRLVYITLARKILCYGSFPAKVLLGTNAYNSLFFNTAITFAFILPYQNQANCLSPNDQNLIETTYLG